MSYFLAVPLKKSWEVDLIKPLTLFISNTFGTNQDDYKTAILEFNKLRNNVLSKALDKHESSIELLSRYVDQLNAVEGKFPFSENQIRINFKWQDAFDKGSMFSGKKSLTIPSGNYEKACILYNLAALQSQVALKQNIETDDGLKVAAKLFQTSSGIFAFLKDNIRSMAPGDLTPDLDPEALSCLHSLMLSQAQDCFIRKTIADRMNPAMIAKLSNQCQELYADTLKLLQLNSTHDIWPSDWVPCVAGKQAGYHSLSEFYQSVHCKNEKNFGEEITRLRKAKELMLAAETRGSHMFMFSEQQRQIQTSLDSAVKDNNFIYHARIPEKSELSTIPKVVLAKPLPLTFPTSPKFKDLFESVVPLAVHQALTAFESRKSELVNKEIGRLREATQLLNGVLASLNLPAAIEDLGGSKVPSSLLDKAEKTRSQGGIVALNKLMSDLPESLQRNKEILDEAERILNEEQKSDMKLREQFKEKWSRTASDKLSAPFRSEISKYRQIIDTAVGADKVVHERYNTHKNAIEMLSKPDTEITRQLPSGSPVSALQGTPIVKELRQLMEQVEAMKAEREVMENEMKTTNSNMSSKFMSALARDGALDENSLSGSELDRIYSPLRSQISESLSRQESLLANIQRVNTQFTNAKSQSGTGAQRDQVLKDLASGFDHFMELKNNLTEGNKFYSDLTTLLVKLQSRISDFCFARKTEKEELMSDLQTSIVRQASDPPPAAPNYQQPTGIVQGNFQSISDASGDSRRPPERPPPPVRPPAPAPPTAAQPAATAPTLPPVAQQPYPGAPPQAPYPGVSAPAVPYPTTTYPPYPAYPPGGYVPPPMPQGYNPYAQYGYPSVGSQPSSQQAPQAPYPGYQYTPQRPQ